MAYEQTITLNTQSMALSSLRRVYKTEGFIGMTRRMMSVDAFLSRIAEGIFKENIFPEALRAMAVCTQDGQYTLYFCRLSGDSRLTREDIVFYKLITTRTDEGGVDRTLSELLNHRELTFTVKEADGDLSGEDFSRIYLVGSGDGLVNFPLLNDTQRAIVETEDANMLVQGVAGSGKTNVCVEKIVYCACRNYRGKVLYTTFSRGLLTETRNRVTLFTLNIEHYIAAYESGNVIFLDDNHKGAVENKLGILFDTDEDGNILQSLKRIAAFLKEKVEYKLIEDIYSDFFPQQRIATESVFLNEYMRERKRLAGSFERIRHIAPEIVYKEIYGMIFGKFEPGAPAPMMTKEEYVEARRESFTRTECETIYYIATDYRDYLEKSGYTDNNLMSRALLQQIKSPVYSVAIIDEAQDFTQVNLCMIKQLSRKLFCVGDALQMINPAYFNFGYLKRIMYGDVTGVNELKHNYRSTAKIEAIAQKLGELNIERFGTHSFVLRGQSVKTSLPSRAVFVQERDFALSLRDKRFENVTVVVSSRQKKERLRQILGKTEILTVAEAKGLERNTVILVDVLTDNLEKWNTLQTMTLNRKTADENSVFRYYFNLFYVGISRAKQYLFVAEGGYPKLFEGLFTSCFERKNKQSALAVLTEIAGKIEIDDEELIGRIERFCSLEQYENARIAADRLSTDGLREEQLAFIYVHEHYLRYGRVKDAGVEYWMRGQDARAREMFTQSGDTALFPLMDACKKGGGALDVEIVRFYNDVKDNEIARKLILQTVRRDYDEMLASQKNINESLKGKRRRG